MEALATQSPSMIIQIKLTDGTVGLILISAKPLPLLMPHRVWEMCNMDLSEEIIIFGSGRMDRRFKM